MIYENLLEGLNAQAAQLLIASARKGRRNAISAISRYCVVTTDDGHTTKELLFDQPPTVGQLVKRVGPDAWVVSIKMRRRPRKARQRLAVAAE